jgi:hypothetical protein
VVFRNVILVDRALSKKGVGGLPRFFLVEDKNQKGVATGKRATPFDY